MGGQTALNTALAVAERGILDKYNVELIGAKVDSIKKAEDRNLFKKAMVKIGQKVPPSGHAVSIEEAWSIVEETGFPAIIRPSFTLGGTGGSIAYSKKEFVPLVEHALTSSPVKQVLIEKILNFYEKDIRGRHFALWGLAFKPNTDDMREAPSLTLARELTAHGAEVRGTDPEAIETARAILGDLISYHEDPYEAAEAADALILCTEWNEFRRPDLDRLGKTMKRKLILDGRNILSAQELSNHGFERYAVGLPPIPPT